MKETKEELIENWSEWLLRRLSNHKASNKDYIQMALRECAKDYLKFNEPMSK